MDDSDIEEFENCLKDDDDKIIQREAQEYAEAQEFFDATSPVVPIRFACIGSREISEKMEATMELIGSMLVSEGHWIASGNALGSDAAYARGANKVDPTKVIIYLPWNTYNEEFLVKGNRVTSMEKPEWVEVARKHHPIFDNLKRGAKSMMVRNAGILSKANKCIAYLNHTKTGGGGTGHGWRIAGEMKIPRFDLATLELPSEDPKENLALAKDFFKFLQKPVDG